VIDGLMAFLALQVLWPQSGFTIVCWKSIKMGAH